MEVLKVSAKSNPNSVAGASVLRERAVRNPSNWSRRVKSGSKAVAIARGFVSKRCRFDLYSAFTDIEIDGQERTAMKLLWNR